MSRDPCLRCGPSSCGYIRVMRFPHSLRAPGMRNPAFGALRHCRFRSPAERRMIPAKPDASKSPHPVRTLKGHEIDTCLTCRDCGLRKVLPRPAEAIVLKRQAISGQQMAWRSPPRLAGQPAGSKPQVGCDLRQNSIVNGLAVGSSGVGANWIVIFLAKYLFTGPDCTPAAR